MIALYLTIAAAALVFVAALTIIDAIDTDTRKDQS